MFTGIEFWVKSYRLYFDGSAKLILWTRYGSPLYTNTNHLFQQVVKWLAMLLLRCLQVKFKLRPRPRRTVFTPERVTGSWQLLYKSVFVQWSHKQIQCVVWLLWSLNKYGWNGTGQSMRSGMNYESRPVFYCYCEVRINCSSYLAQGLKCRV